MDARAAYLILAIEFRIVVIADANAPLAVRNRFLRRYCIRGRTARQDCAMSLNAKLLRLFRLWARIVLVEPGSAAI